MSARQFYFTIFIFSVSLKVQKMPSLSVGYLGKDNYLMVLFFMVVDLVGIALAFFILNRLKTMDLKNENNSTKIIKKIILIFTTLYFMLQGTLLYEAIHDLFAHVLFDNLPWTVFSLLLIAVVFYLALTGVKNIGKSVDLYFFVVLISYVILAIFGGRQTDFSVIFPFETTNFKNICDNFTAFNIWFGDFFMILFLGRHCDKIKWKWTSLVYVASMLFVALLFVEFNGIYGEYAAIQSSLVSEISEQSMLGIDIGRVDWFLIILTEVGTIISSSLCLFFAKQCASVLLPKVKQGYVLGFLMIVLYLVDVFYLVDTNIKEMVFMEFSGLFSLLTKVVVFLMILIYCLFKKKSSKKELEASS